jgi:hypothetical protein
MALGFPTGVTNGYLYSPNGSSKTYQWSSTQGAWLIYTIQTTATTVVSPNVSITSGTVSISTITGALVVKGGVGIGGDVHIGGILYTNGVPALTTSSFNISDGPDGGTDINIQHVVDALTGTSTISINNISTLASVTGRGSSTPNIIQITNNTISTSNFSGALVVTGGVGIGGRLNTESIKIADTVFDSTDTYVNTVNEYTIDSYLLSQYRSSKYFIQVSEGAGYSNTEPNLNYQAVEIILTAKNDGTPYMTQYGYVTTGVELGTFGAKGESTGTDILVSLTFKAVSSSPIKHVKVLRTAMTS